MRLSLLATLVSQMAAEGNWTSFDTAKQMVWHCTLNEFTGKAMVRAGTEAGIFGPFEPEFAEHLVAAHNCWLRVKQILEP